MGLDKGQERRLRRAVSTMRVTGRTTKRMEKGRRFTKTENIFRVNLWMIQRREREFGTIKVIIDLRVHGRLIRRKERLNVIFLTILSNSVNILTTCR